MKLQCRSQPYRTILVACLILCCFLLNGCDLPVQQMSATERGVLFRRLPTFLGGGLGTSVASGGEMVILWPWDSIVRIDTGTKNVTLGETQDRDSDLSGFIFTRARDGNEVALKLTVQYRINPDPKTLVALVQRVGSSNQDIEQLIVAVARSQVRQHMNELATSQFVGDETRYNGINNTKIGIQSALDLVVPDGISVLELILDRFEFARINDAGEVDRSYQEKLNEQLRLLEQIQLEERRILVVNEEGQQRKNEMQGKVNRILQEAQGFKKQSEARGTAYLASKENEAKGILALGKAEVEGMIEKINALAGPGGQAILKLSVAENLRKSNPRFVLIGNATGDKAAGKSEIGVERVDINRLVEQIGLMEALREDPDAVTTKPASSMPAGRSSAISSPSSSPSLKGMEPLGDQ